MGESGPGGIADAHVLACRPLDTQTRDSAMSARPDAEQSPQSPQLLTGRVDTGELFALRRVASEGENVSLFVTNWQPGGSRSVSCRLEDTWDELVDMYGAPPPRTADDSWARVGACIARGGAALLRDGTGAPVALVLHHLHGRRIVDARLPAAREAATLVAVDEAMALAGMRTLYEALEGSRAVLRLSSRMGGSAEKE